MGILIWFSCGFITPAELITAKQLNALFLKMRLANQRKTLKFKIMEIQQDWFYIGTLLLIAVSLILIQKFDKK